MSSNPSIRNASKPAITESIHGDFLEAATPQWLIDTSSPRRAALKNASTVMPQWYQDASAEQRKTLDASFSASMTAQAQLDKTMASFKDIDAFAEPLLTKELKDRYGVEVDVTKTLLTLRRPLEISILEVEVASFEFMTLTLLQAALHNFEAWECKAGAYHKSSCFGEQETPADTYKSVPLKLSVSEFLSLCRSLDIGAKYQAYLRSFFHPPEADVEKTLREHFIAAQKATMKAAADQALLTKDILPADHAMIQSVINGEVNPWMGKQQVWFRDMGLMKKRMTGCAVFVICEKYRYAEELIVYIPHDPEHPFKRYTWDQFKQEFKRLLTARDPAEPDQAAPTAYQRFLSQFLSYDQRPYYFSQFVQEAADSPTDFLRSPWRTFTEFGELGYVLGIKELPPRRNIKMEPAEDPFIGAVAFNQRGGPAWSPNQDLWDYLYKQSCAKVLADARSHAVPSDDVDAKARAEKLAHLLQIGLMGLNFVSMFVPVLGEVMMVAMAGQLLYETLEGAIEWGEGDKRAAKAHLIDVAENLAMVAVMAGVGAGAGKLVAARATPVIEGLEPVTLPNGKTRLWQPDLGAYKRDVVLDTEAGPNALGQYVVDGKTYIRLDDTVVEQTFDPDINKWRIKHPDAEAYQPVLESNGRGAWRHTLERPMQWDRLTLLRRMGHETEVFPDELLLTAADVSGVTDNALRKMHMDNAAPPPELRDAMDLLKADRDASEVLEQLQHLKPADDRIMHALPLLTKMPRWPQGRILEVFERADLSGSSIRYGAERRLPDGTSRPPIKVSRADVLNGQLTTRIVQALDEPEIIDLLGQEGTRVTETIPQVLDRRFADYAQTRQPAIFDSLYKGVESADARVRGLQRECPGLGVNAAQEVLAHASGEEILRLDSTRRAPLRMLEEARWYARQARQTKAFAGLHSENIASADSRRLALHALENLPGWPATVRLEVRDGSPSGLLLDSIGNETATQIKYLVKDGPHYQAFNERGETLNSIPSQGDNFYASIMHALPDDTRAAIDLPHVGQSGELQRNIIDYAVEHRSEVASALNPRAKSYKPPVRINGTRTGYYASGRGRGVDDQLTARAEALYPAPEQAQAFLRAQEGKTPQQIHHVLQAKTREWETLETTLDQWTGPQSELPEYRAKVRVAQALKDSWRTAPLTAQTPGSVMLRLDCEAPWPVLEADFSHVQTLQVTWGRVMNDNLNAFLSTFSHIRELWLSNIELVPGTGSAILPLTLPSAVLEMPALRTLTCHGSASASLTAEFSTRLNALTSLEKLNLVMRGSISPEFSAGGLGGLAGLKRLRIIARHMRQWPANVENLPQLEFLDLRATAISAIPESMYTGHEQLWRGLSLDWSKFSYDEFLPAYEYLRKNGPLSGLDETLMVHEYCRGELNYLLGDDRGGGLVGESVLHTWDSPENQLAGIRALTAEHAGIFRPFYPSATGTALRGAQPSPNWLSGTRSTIYNALQRNWRGLVRQRYGARIDASLLEIDLRNNLSGSLRLFTLPELPPLPAGSFSHVRTLRLDGLDAPVAQIKDFLKAFSKAQTLEISGGRLTELPAAPESLPDLTQLDLHGNNIVLTPAVQAQFNGFAKLARLNLRGNPLGSINVAALTALEALDLNATQLRSWPAGAEFLPKLSWLDLRNNQLSSLPQDVFIHDDILLKTELGNNPLNDQGQQVLTTARQRIEQARGLSAGALARLSEQMPFNVFPPAETSWTVLSRVPRLPQAMVEGDSFVYSLQQIRPEITEAQALEKIQRMRSSAMSDPQIGEQISQWRQDSEALTRKLNDWLCIAEVRTSRSIVSLQTRSQAASRIRGLWWQAVVDHPGGMELNLNLSGIQTGDLPALGIQLPGVTALDLTGVRLTAQGSNDFLRAFPGVRRLCLNGNELAALPEAVRDMSQLSELELAANHFSDLESNFELPMQGSLLKRIDLSSNRLASFDSSPFASLEALDLAYNSITDWPGGTLDLALLRRLNLSGNGLRALPEELLDGSHDTLLAGTNLSDNLDLSRYSLDLLIGYSDTHERAAVAGISRSELVERDQFRGDSHSEGSGSDHDSDDGSNDDNDRGGEAAGPAVEAVEELDPQQSEIDVGAVDDWLADSTPEQALARRELWRRLAGEEQHERFFNLIALLPDSSEFRFARADLTRRLWEVISAACENTELRELLFLEAETHGTCADGRILTFSQLETRVFTYHALRNIPPGNAVLKGRALLPLLRRLFRLYRVDTLAEHRAIQRHSDIAEVRLEYRIGLTNGWDDGLDLPGQPAHMLYGTPISEARAAKVRASILEAERSDALSLFMATQDFWRAHLAERYPQEFSAINTALDDERLEVFNALEARNERGEFNEADYPVEMREAMDTIEDKRNQQLAELTRREIEVLQPTAGDPEIPAPRSPQPGPSRLP
ncbi:hypothetical protein PS718_01750 [Pseudomonas fluorescens]|uniref:RING-type E3 ubiquitin transferase n=1 Tax=Pseudomonas fluorescens TaxID=294 RepID=A0A5E7BLI0_PSEFL|nr:NEL-type E3 ubiquitin ligase domain-containing protein [Pseudomonas fluorescens]VVN89194.1 hypothetical protein PS718_01750 [Pseudomonas fluorescens]